MLDFNIVQDLGQHRNKLHSYDDSEIHRYDVTSILKACIMQADGQRLDAFVHLTITLKAVETALAIGLTRDELAEALFDRNTEHVISEVPQDIDLT